MSRINQDAKETAIETIPSFGDIRSAGELGHKHDNGSRFVWHACELCGNGSWVQIVKGNPVYKRCADCARRDGSTKYREGNPNWKGGSHNDQGYQRILLDANSDNFFRSMANKNGYVPEHRLFMAKHLGRCLQAWEIVHHKNGDRADNRLENLELTNRGSHTLSHNKGYKDGYAQGLFDGKDKQIKELRKRIVELELRLNGGTVEQ